MDGLPQYLKIRSNSQNQKKKKMVRIFAQVHYLDEFVDIMIHNLVGRHAKKDLKLLNHEGILCSRQCEVRVIPNAGRMGGGLLFTFIGYTLPLREWGNFFHRGSWGSYPRWLSDRGRGSDGDPLSITCTILFPSLEKGSFFLVLIFAYIPWLNFVVIFTKENHLLREKKKKKKQACKM